jgi:hypothetical protein
MAATAAALKQCTVNLHAKYKLASYTLPCSLRKAFDRGISRKCLRQGNNPSVVRLEDA